MTTPPMGPAKPVASLVDGSGDESYEESLDFVARQRYQVVRPWPEAVLVGADDGQEGMGEHGEGDPAGPGRIAAELVLVQAGQALSGLEVSSTLHLDPATRTRTARGTGWGE